MTLRPLTPAQSADLNAPGSAEALLGFMLIRHSGLPAPVRIVSDVLDYSWQGALWTGVPFEPRAVADADAPPSVEIRVQNVNGRIGRALRAAEGRALVSLWVLTSADFDLSVVPRLPLPGPEPVPLYRHLNYELQDVDANSVELTGRLVLRDFSQEFLGVRATSDRCPGLWA